LNFNYKIVHLPENLVDYLVAHELCHLKELNHSKAFWGLVSSAIPNYKISRRQLRNLGWRDHNMKSFRVEVIDFVKKVPSGLVVSYGQVAAGCGHPRAARQVGAVLRGLSIADGKIPWWRVVNNRGKLALRAIGRRQKRSSGRCC